MGIFLEGEDSHGDRGLGRLVEFRFKAPPGTTFSSITAHTSSGQRNCASWAYQPQKSVTLLPCPGGRTTKSTKGHVVALEENTSQGSGFGGLGVACCLQVPKFADSNPAEAVRIFQDEKNVSAPSFGGEVKPSVHVVDLRHVKDP